MDSPPTATALLTSGDEATPLRASLACRGFASKAFSTTRTTPKGRTAPGRWRQILLGRRLARAHREDAPRLIHALGIETADLAIELAARWRRPYLLTVEDFLRPGEGLRLARRWCRGVIVPGRELAEDLIRNVGVPSRLVSVVPAGVAVAPTRSSSPARPWLPVVGTAVGADLGSGLPTFLEAARRVLDAGIEAEFVLAGLGTRSALARRLAGGLDMIERITIAEGIDLGRSFWPILDVYAQTSRVPSSGRPMLSAMAHGVPAIASDVAGLREIADEGRAARLVSPGDAEMLAGAILELLSNRDASSDLGESGRRRIEAAHSPAREADALAAIYRAAIDAGDGAGVRLRVDTGSAVVASRRS